MHSSVNLLIIGVINVIMFNMIYISYSLVYVNFIYSSLHFILCTFHSESMVLSFGCCCIYFVGRYHSKIYLNRYLNSKVKFSGFRFFAMRCVLLCKISVCVVGLRLFRYLSVIFDCILFMIYVTLYTMFSDCF